MKAVSKRKIHLTAATLVAELSHIICDKVVEAVLCICFDFCYYIETKSVEFVIRDTFCMCQCCRFCNVGSY